VFVGDGYEASFVASSSHTRVGEEVRRMTAEGNIRSPFDPR